MLDCLCLLYQMISKCYIFFDLFLCSRNDRLRSFIYTRNLIFTKVDFIPCYFYFIYYSYHGLSFGLLYYFPSRFVVFPSCFAERVFLLRCPIMCTFYILFQDGIFAFCIYAPLLPSQSTHTSPRHFSSRVFLISRTLGKWIIFYSIIPL